MYPQVGNQCHKLQAVNRVYRQGGLTPTFSNTRGIHGVCYWVFLSDSEAGVDVRRQPRNITSIADGRATVMSVALMKCEMRWIDTVANRTSRTQHTYATAPITLVNSLHTTRLLAGHILTIQSNQSRRQDVQCKMMIFIDSQKQQ